jgi:mannose-6-phosphate isomerase class I
MQWQSLQVLCKSLTYRCGSPCMLKPERIRDCMHRYQPPFEEFQVLSFQVTQPGTVSIPAQLSPMILLCLSSAGLHCLQVPAPYVCVLIIRFTVS